MTTRTRPRFDLHEAVTNQIVAAIEEGTGALEMPWHKSGAAITRPKNISTGKRLPRCQHHRPVGRRRAPWLYRGALGHLPPVAEARRAGAQGPEVLAHRLLQDLRA